MEMNRILVLGCSGAGKSTLSRKLGHIFHLPIIHLDAYFWQPNWVKTQAEEWDRQVTQFAEREQWIIDGNYSRTLDLRLQRADAVVWLDMPRWLCIYRIIKRRIMYHGKTRPDLNEGCPEKLDLDFFAWVWNYKKRSRARTLSKLAQIEGRMKIIILKSPKEVRNWIEQVESDGKI